MRLLHLDPNPFWRHLWVRVALPGALIVAVVFLGYEVLERTLLSSVAPSGTYVLHLMRGMGTAFLLATWAFLQIRRARAEHDTELEVEIDRLKTELRERTRDLDDARATLRHHERISPLLATEDLELARAVLAFERHHVERVLERCGGKRDAAARALGLSPATFYRHLQKLGLKGYRQPTAPPAA
jgi:hypothetical protein